MPIIYVHGVNVRTRKPFEDEYRVYLKRYLAPAISTDADHVLIDDAFWGDYGVKFAWFGDSRPATRLLGMGPQDAPNVPSVEQALIADLLSTRVKNWPQAAAVARGTGGLVGGATPPRTVAFPQLDLAKLSSPQLSDLLTGMVSSTIEQPAERAVYQIAADETAFDPTVLRAFQTEASRDKQLEVLLEGFRHHVEKERRLRLDLLHDWLANLTKWFPNYPDPPVLFAEQLMRQGDFKSACDALLKLRERDGPHTAECLAYAAAITDRLMGLEGRLASEQLTGLKEIHRQLTSTLAHFRPGGMFVTLTGTPTDPRPGRAGI